MRKNLNRGRILGIDIENLEENRLECVLQISIRLWDKKTFRVYVFAKCVANFGGFDVQNELGSRLMSEQFVGRNLNKRTCFCIFCMQIRGNVFSWVNQNVFSLFRMQICCFRG